jgi:hypothetical protein
MVRRSVKASWVCPAAALMIAAWATAARADDDVIVHVPFDFTVGDTQLPAGNYTLSADADNPSVLLIASADRQHLAYVLTTSSSSIERLDQPKLEFTEVEGRHFLSKVVTSSLERDVPLPPSALER